MTPKNKTAKKRGRPGLDRKRIMAKVCARVSQGELVKYAAAAEGVEAKTIREWSLEDTELGASYARAREQQAHSLAEQAVEIADGEDALTELYAHAIEEEDRRLAGDRNRYKIISALKANLVARDRMRMDARKWLTSKIAPRLYGEKIEHTGPEGGPIQVQVWKFGKREIAF